MNRVNYQKELDRCLDSLAAEGRIPRLFLHACCAPCSSYVLEYLSRYFEITVFFYNPNIYPEEEYRRRAEEQRRLIAAIPAPHPILLEEGRYQPEEFFQMAKGLEDCPEGGERCRGCYELRLREAATGAKAGGYDYFTTTLSISPLKDGDKLNQIGRALEQAYGVRYLCSDFKKKGGYQRSIQLSKEYGLYRQDYCGCIYSRMERERRKAAETGAHQSQ